MWVANGIPVVPGVLACPSRNNTKEVCFRLGAVGSKAVHMVISVFQSLCLESIRKKARERRPVKYLAAGMYTCTHVADR